MRLTSYHNSVYTMIANNCISTGSRVPGFFDDENYGGPGRSAIFGPRGVELARCGDYESRKATMIPIAQFRKTHRIPDVHMQLYRPVLDQYRERYDHSGYLEYIPKDKRDAFRVFNENARWTHYW